MSTRGVYGFRKNGIEKLTYNHCDSYPDWLGEKMAMYCASHTLDELNKICDAIVLVQEDSRPTKEQIALCASMGLLDLGVSTGRVDEWYCLLREAQGEPMVWDRFIKEGHAPLMIDNHSCMDPDSWCEYAYIINLDKNVLEFYSLPEKLLEFPLDDSFADAVDRMNKACGMNDD